VEAHQQAAPTGRLALHERTPPLGGRPPIR
jgi:hypothetical protein